MKTEQKKNWVIRVNGRYFDGLSERENISDAKRYTQFEARTLNRVVMSGRGKVVNAK